MSNDSTYWLVVSILIASALSFVAGRFFERADRWLQDWDAERRAKKAALAAREARLAIPRRAPSVRERVAAVGRGIARIAAPGGDAEVWR